MKNDKRTTTQMEILYGVSQAMVHQHDISALVNEVLDILETEMGMKRSTLTLRRPGTDVLAIEASRGLTQKERDRGQYRVGEGVTGRVAAQKEAILIPDIRKESSFLDRTQSHGDEKIAFLCAPIIREGRVIGTLSINVLNDDEESLQQDLSFLQLAANLIAEAVAAIRAQVEERESLVRENKRLRRQLGDQYHPGNLIGNCGAMRAVYQQVAQVADSNATVLIRGESGTGKELVAKAIHYASDRKGGPFVAVNCAALPEQLIESELFGHEKGAFTGAAYRRQGRFELANGGTIFLDEIGDIAPSVQVRLLRVLQERCFERVGGAETVSINVRVLAATSRDLEEGIRENRFREDLFYRLNVFPIHLPPLRARRSDVILLADHFLEKYARAYGRNIRRISTTAINMMTVYHWPGNVRELENCIERAVLTSTDDVIHGYTLPPSLQTSDQTHTRLIPEEGASLKTMVESYEREIIVDALKKQRGNAAAAARYLQTTQRIVNYKISRLGITPKAYR
jgi:Nif-specific regulatory protein